MLRCPASSQCVWRGDEYEVVDHLTSNGAHKMRVLTASESGSVDVCLRIRLHEDKNRKMSFLIRAQSHYFLWALRTQAKGCLYLVYVVPLSTAQPHAVRIKMPPLLWQGEARRDRPSTLAFSYPQHSVLFAEKSKEGDGDVRVLRFGVRIEKPPHHHHHHHQHQLQHHIPSDSVPQGSVVGVGITEYARSVSAASDSTSSSCGAEECEDGSGGLGGGGDDDSSSCRSWGSSGSSSSLGSSGGSGGVGGASGGCGRPDSAGGGGGIVGQVGIVSINNNNNLGNMMFANNNNYSGSSGGATNNSGCCLISSINSSIPSSTSSRLRRLRKFPSLPETRSETHYSDDETETDYAESLCSAAASSVQGAGSCCSPRSAETLDDGDV